LDAIKKAMTSGMTLCQLDNMDTVFFYVQLPEGIIKY
jgi:hypothetical protein